MQRTGDQRFRVGFVMEQALGHVTYMQNLQSAFGGLDRLEPVWMPVPFACDGLMDRLPGIKRNWTVRGSLRGHQALRAQGGPRAFDALFFHTQTVALLAPLAARNTPAIISLDATPLNYDSVGVYYGHRATPRSAAERAKRLVYRRVFESAVALTTWSEWAKNSLCDDYGIDSDRITVIAPGTNLALFPFGSKPRPPAQQRPLRILFVGGDFERKGGPLLLACMRNGLAARCEVHIVTRQPVPPTPGVHVYSNLGPNDPRLLALYRDADIFALPTYADCLAVVLGEAMAAGLPVVTTRVGAQPEAVQDGRSGIIVPPGDAETLGRALLRLAGDAALRTSMGQEGRRIAEGRFDTNRNAERLAGVIGDGISRWREQHKQNGSVPQPGATAG